MGNPLFMRNLAQELVQVYSRLLAQRRIPQAQRRDHFKRLSFVVIWPAPLRKVVEIPETPAASSLQIALAVCGRDALRRVC